MTENDILFIQEINDVALSRGAQAAFSPTNSFVAYGVQNGAKSTRKKSTY